jgi:hypothetical protein
MAQTLDANYELTHIFTTVSKFFDLSSDFPVDRVFVRNGTGEVSRTMYIANAALKVTIFTESLECDRELTAFTSHS